MTSIERTAYPRFTRAPSVKELRDLWLSTTSDQTLIDAMNFIIAHEHDPKKYSDGSPSQGCSHC